MQITVLFFAYLKEKTGIDRLAMEIAPETTIKQLKTIIRNQYINLGEMLDQVIVSVNQEFASDDVVVADGSEVAFFPPVSGGNGETNLLAVTYEPINSDEIINRLIQNTTGGIVSFIGVVRGLTGDESPTVTVRLSYEAYEEMALKKIEQVSQEIMEKWPKVERNAIIQRLGNLDPGIPSVFVACAGSHRDIGIFEAARYGINRLKEIVPIWKKEILDGEEKWIEGNYFPRPGE